MNGYDEMVLAVLEGTHHRLSDESRWSRGADARNYDGDEVAALDKNALSWCLSGGVQKESWMAVTGCEFADDAFMDRVNAGVHTKWWDETARLHNNVMALLHAESDVRFHTSAVEANDQIGHPAAMELLEMVSKQRREA